MPSTILFTIGVRTRAVGKPIGKLKIKALSQSSAKLLTGPRFMKVIIKDMKMLMNIPIKAPISIPEYFFDIFFILN